MSHLARSSKPITDPVRSMKPGPRLSLKNNFLLIEELIQRLENVAIALKNGASNVESMNGLVESLRSMGPQLEVISKDTLDRAFVVFRNASQDERLNILTRLNLLELIELRARGWEDNGTNTYYKTKQATSAELPEGHHSHQQQQQLQQQQMQLQQHYVDSAMTAYMSTSPTFAGSSAFAAVGTAQQMQLLLGPGEVIRNSGKFPKPTKIPGKTYWKDEVVIRNSDSGKVMGIKGRRVHMIEELSETIISFQRVNTGAKERLVQITGPTEEKINYAKQLIEDTIRRNASPVRLEMGLKGAGHGVDPNAPGGGGGSCSSLASSNSDEAAVPRIHAAVNAATSAGPHISTRLTFNTLQNYINEATELQKLHLNEESDGDVGNMSPNVGVPMSTPGGRVMRANQQMLLHSFSTNDAALGEYKHTVNVGQHVLKITGDSCDLVRAAKLVLDDYFSSAEFLRSVEAGAGFDGTLCSPLSTPTTPLGQPSFALHSGAPPMARDSGIGLNFIAGGGQLANNSHSVAETDDEVFAMEGNALSTSASQSNGLARSRRSHFSRKESTEMAAAATAANAGAAQTINDGGNGSAAKADASAGGGSSNFISYDYDTLLHYSKSPHAWAMPAAWPTISAKYPAILRNKDLQDESDRFNSERYLQLMRSSSKRIIACTGSDETNADNDNQDNE